MGFGFGEMLNAVFGGASGADAARGKGLLDYDRGINAIQGNATSGALQLAGANAQAQGALGQGYGQARNDLARWGVHGMGQVGQGYGNAQGALAGARGDMLGAYGQGQGAIGAGLAGGLGQIAAGNQAAQQMLSPHIQQDAAARDQYAQRLMSGLSGGDDPYWNRLARQRTDAMEASLAKQGLLGSTVGAQSVADSGAQLQQVREQQFFERAQGLFNAGAAQQAAGLANQAGLAGAGMYGDAGRASAGMYGDQAQAMGMLGRGSADLYARGGETMGSMGADLGRGLAGLGTGLADRASDAWQNYGRGMAGTYSSAGQSIGGMYGNRAGAHGGGWLKDFGQDIGAMYGMLGGGA